MKLIVWLGNPWDKYKLTRHNAGFIIIDEICKDFDFQFNKKFNSDFGKWVFDGVEIFLAKPQTYMNLSGDAISKIANFYKILPKDILVIHDEIDFDTGRIEMKNWWSHAWHNGLRDIIAKLGTDKFWRLRIWVSRPPLKEQVVDYVLTRFPKSELDIVLDKKDFVYSKINEFISL